MPPLNRESRLFQPLRLGPVQLSHRIIMGPISSNLADTNCLLDATAGHSYYTSRARVPGTLLIAEATFISAAASGTTESRTGIWTTAQVAAWKQVVDGVHAAGSHIFLQLWALGRGADPVVKARDATGDVVSSSAVAIPLEEGEPGPVVVPRALTSDEVRAYVEQYALAARNAVVGAGFDGVEIHGGNGSLVDQFTQDVVNAREDEWGGSVEKRSRFGLEVVRAVGEAVGFDRVGFRVSPFSTYGGMGCTNAIEQFSHLLTGLKHLGVAYVHLVESRIAGRVDVAAGEPLDPFIALWGDDSPIVLAGGYNPETAQAALDKEFRDKDCAVAFGRAFVKNPDLVQRLKDGVPLAED